MPAEEEAIDIGPKGGRVGAPRLAPHRATYVEYGSLVLGYAGSRRHQSSEISIAGATSCIIVAPAPCPGGGENAPPRYCATAASASDAAPR